MAWFKKPKYTRLEPPKMRDRIPQGLMVKCEACVGMVLKEELEKNLYVCPKCGDHQRIDAPSRIEVTFDTFEEDNKDLSPGDPLEFFDSKSYVERLEGDREKTGLRDACVTGVGEILGFRVAATVMDFRFRGGSMGSVVGEKLTRCIERAIDEKNPVVVFCSSGGARMQEGIFSLMQMAKTSAAVGRLGQARLPYITVLCNPTTGGVTASFASIGDVILAEPGAMVGFAGPRVIEQTIRDPLPRGFQTAEFVRDCGFIDKVVPRKEMRETLATFISLLSGQDSARFPTGTAAGVIDATEVI